MIYNSAEEYYFWQGIKSGVYKELELFQLAKSNNLLEFKGSIYRDCESSFVVGHELGTELNETEYKLLILPKIRFKYREI